MIAKRTDRRRQKRPSLIDGLKLSMARDEADPAFVKQQFEGCSDDALSKIAELAKSEFDKRTAAKAPPPPPDFANMTDGEFRAALRKHGL